MQHISDATIDALITPADAQQTLLQAWQDFGHARAAMQARVRTEAQGIKLSTLGAVIPDQQVVGAKVYTTIQGQFSFVILLFSSETGQALASFDAAAITRLRTAACSVLAARRLAHVHPDMTLAVLGAGQQGLSHLRQLREAFPLREIRIFDPHLSAEQLAHLQQESEARQVKLRACTAAEAVQDADVVVTASRATAPLFDGTLLKPGAFVAAIGSSLPHTRELDDTALARARSIIVEWKPQSLQEAGDLRMAAPELRIENKLGELAQVLTGELQPRQSPDDIIIYKSVGVGLQDVALAGLAWKKLQQGLQRPAGH
ncbi:ornithine cyclodeaminase family protein [Corticibacter populi]|uniref:Ornithine cyclodeaminase family protein n=1 Tax=Corticibacter populi TaxID=1550736 RepID=A0A3M6QS86_9BURK|nr:ornithine cyclodeaminase family protein [Corticibacter populi]RMX05897.1 ornithine cyclodeaminase family protein [Corticibacter populi]RZS30784.1 ornithine cyclodeaminase [Corticibacter populi]